MQDFFPGVLFEMITSDMRKKPVEHVDEFHDRNFTILAEKEKDYKIYLQYIIESFQLSKR
jgi:hypothetical protein